MKEPTVRVQKIKKDTIRTRLILFGALALILILCSVFCEHLTHYDPYLQNLKNAKAPPSPEHIFGTDRYGRDMLSRVIVGSKTSIFSTLLLVGIVTILGTMVGIFCGWHGKWIDKEGQMYFCNEDQFYLVPTAEVPVTNIFRDVILSEDQFPQKLTAYTPCFRREAGSYGKDVRGLNRLHQFDKVEIVRIEKPENSYAALDEMIAHVESLVNALGLKYRILRLCGGDMSFTSAITYDFELWSAAQGRWLEISSVSNFETFQANRLKCRYKDADGKTQLVHTLNGSSLALPRVVAALLEDNQKGGYIEIPGVLRPYTGFDRID